MPFNPDPRKPAKSAFLKKKEGSNSSNHKSQ